MKTLTTLAAALILTLSLSPAAEARPHHAQPVRTDLGRGHEHAIMKQPIRRDPVTWRAVR